MNLKEIDLKRFFDVFLVLLSVIFLVMPFFLICILVYFRLGRPVIFCQERIGLNGVVFKLYKFRSMSDARDGCGNLLPDVERLKPFGKFLRSSSLDELPGLYNVLKGDMSLVGPRPLLVEYLPLYSKDQLRRHEVRPGITGWAQVNGRNSISWEAKFKLDVWYVDNLSLRLDLMIIGLTIRKVLLRDGISAEGEATMSKFTGNGK